MNGIIRIKFADLPKLITQSGQQHSHTVSQTVGESAVGYCLWFEDGNICISEVDYNPGPGWLEERQSTRIG